MTTALFAGSCSTTINIPEGLSPAEMIQRAQEARDRNRYGAAMQYYQALHERNITNINLVCEAEYEISFIQYKQKKYDQAKEGFNALMERYDTPNREALPLQFEILAKKILAAIDEKENPVRTKQKKEKSKTSGRQ